MIRISGLSAFRGGRTVLDGLDLHVPEGSFFGLLGPNGAGKTTTIECLAGLLRPGAGSITVAGVDVVHQPRAVQMRVGLVPQALALYENLSVIRNLRIFAGLYGLGGALRTQRIDDALGVAGLADRASDRVETLSGGMKRRLNLVAALLHDPPLIVCDEPTVGVDPHSRRQLFDTLCDFHRRGRTILYTTHYMEEVQTLCQQVAILDRGRLIAADTLEALLDAGAGTRTFEVTLDSEHTGDDVRRALEAAGIQARGVRATPRTLESVFMERTGRPLESS